MRLTHRLAIPTAFALMLSITSRLMAGPADGTEKHWAFQPIRRPEVPVVADRATSRNPIDRFVMARLEGDRLKPVAAADRRTLIRRLFLDLIGLPPTPEEVESFINDRSESAIARLVDDLLARSQYGERWARHWLDVVRYAESNGYERDGAKPFAWRYRDYVIDALNRDVPYNRFLTEQIAGDEIEGSDARMQIATTFMRLGTWDDEPADPAVDRYDQLDDVLGTAATAFLGITLRCARCHDHKFEPFSQADYYRMLAVFAPLERPQEGRTELDQPVGTAAELHELQSHEKRLDAAWKPIETLIRPDINRLIAGGARTKDGQLVAIPAAMSAEVIAAFKAQEAQRTSSQRELVRQFAGEMEALVRKIASAKISDALAPLDKEFATLDRAWSSTLPRAYIWSERGPTTPPTHVLKRGDPTRPGAVATPGVPAVLGGEPIGRPEPTATSTGRRLWLARWLTHADNPLVARVIVNRIWQFHFGEGLVATSSDFGVMGDPPSHPELLDWLASELIASGWRLKPLHRLIVLSQTYQRSSAHEPAAARADPGGKLLWHWRPRRLEAEVVRDSILAVSGRLNLQMRGPSFYPKLPREVLEGQSRPGEGWGKSDDREQMRRSIYIFAKRSLAVPELELFDAPDTTGSCDRRMVSTTGPQALTFLNGLFIHEQAEAFASRLVLEAGPDASSRIERAFALALGRRPRPEELRATSEFIAKQERLIEAESKSQVRKPESLDACGNALAAFCLVILNMNEFVYAP